MESIQIDQCKNGYIVSNAPVPGDAQVLSTMHVFETFDSLVAHLRTVFASK